MTFQKAGSDQDNIFDTLFSLFSRTQFNSLDEMNKRGYRQKERLGWTRDDGGREKGAAAIYNAGGCQLSGLAEQERYEPVADCAKVGLEEKVEQTSGSDNGGGCDSSPGKTVERRGVGLKQCSWHGRE